MLFTVEKAFVLSSHMITYESLQDSVSEKSDSEDSQDFIWSSWLISSSFKPVWDILAVNINCDSYPRKVITNKIKHD